MNSTVFITMEMFLTYLLIYLSNITPTIQNKISPQAV